MNAKTDGWESYTDEAGRRHWRWPAAVSQREGDHPLADPGPRQQIGLPRQQMALQSPLRLKGK